MTITFFIVANLLYTFILIYLFDQKSLAIKYLPSVNYIIVVAHFLFAYFKNIKLESKSQYRLGTKLQYKKSCGSLTCFLFVVPSVKYDKIERLLNVFGFCLLSLPLEEYCLNVYWQEALFFISEIYIQCAKTIVVSSSHV